MAVDRKLVSYLVLEPIDQEGSRYMVPASNAAVMSKIRPLLSRQELHDLLISQPVHTESWIQDENLRKQTYRELINSGDREKLLQMVHSLYRHRAAQLAAGRKCHICDENFLRDAEKLLAGEISLVLQMNSDEAKAYLREKLNEGT